MRLPWARPRREDLTTDEARRHLALAKAQQQRVDQAVKETRRLQRENHFGERIGKALGGTR